MDYLFISVSSAIIPTWFLLWWFWRSDKFTQPPRLIWNTFFLSLASIVPAYLLSQLLSPFVRTQTNEIDAAVFEALFQVAIPEEFAKFCVLFFYCARQNLFKNPMDGVVYGATASMGFAVFENVVFAIDSNIPTASMRAGTSIIGHCALGIIMGSFITLHEISKRYYKEKIVSRGQLSYFLGMAILVPIFIHTFYEAPLFLLEERYNSPLFLIEKRLELPPHVLSFISILAIFSAVLIAFKVVRFVFHKQKILESTTS